MRELSSWMVVLGFVSAACSGSVETSSGGSGAGSSSGGTGGGGPSFCPAAEPAGGSCAGVPEGFRCTYGNSVRPDCRHEWLCLNGTWTTTKSVCLDPPPDHCMFQSPPSGEVCLTDGDVCVVGAATICLCTSCSGLCMPPPPKWTCVAPPMTPGCPEIVPNDGTACDEAGLVCSYGPICTISSAQVKCENGLWRWDQTIACPA